MLIQLVTVLFSLTHSSHAGDVCAPKLEGRINVANLGPRVFLEDNVLYFDRDRVDAPYYLNQFGTLFNEEGYPVTKIEGKRIYDGHGREVTQVTLDHASERCRYVYR